MHLTAMGAGLLFQGKEGLRKPQVRQCFGVPKQLHSARMLGSLRRLKLLYFCSMIFGYEVLNQGRGREEIRPASRDLFFSCSEPALFWVSEVFIQLFVKIKLAFSRGTGGHLGLRSCSTGRADVKSTSKVGVQHGQPWSQHPTSAAFLPPSPLSLDTPSAFIRRPPPKRQAIPTLCLFLPLETRSEAQVFMNEVNHLPPGFCKHGPYPCPQTRAPARLLQTSLPLFPERRAMDLAQPPWPTACLATLHQGWTEAVAFIEGSEGGRKQPLVDSGGGGKHTNKPQTPTTFNYHLCAPPPLAPAVAGVPALACLEL